MKPFNLEEALSGRAVKLRDGRKAYVRHHETELEVNPDYKLLGYDADGDQLSWRESGSYLSERITADYDIIGMYPETRIINGFEVPAPETQALKDDNDYYVVDVNDSNLCMEYVWYGYIFDFRMLERGLVFLNKEDAVATAKAMLGIDPHTKEKKNETI